MFDKQYIKINIRRVFMLLISLVLICEQLYIPVLASDNKEIQASIYESTNNKYLLEDAKSSDTNAIGELSVKGDYYNYDKGEIPAFEVTSDTIAFTYDFDKKTTSNKEWYITDDATKKVNGIQLDNKMMSGAIIIQTSMDGENWNDELQLTDIFNDSKELTDFYDAKSIQLQNGCFYRVFIAYKLERKLKDSKILFVTKQNYEHKYIVEEYVFYAGNNTDEVNADSTPQKRLGSKINTGKDNGYSENNKIDKDDPHYGWDIGYFYVNGYTRETSSDDKTPVFLKNVGDKVTLWFHLLEDIRKLHGNENLTISEDKNGYDQQFEISQTNFKRGTLIIQYINPEGVASKPIIYTDYLAANAKTDANTKVEIFEEGDYIVSLDYEIESKSGVLNAIPSYTNYKIMFDFSIRNGNCIVFPFDIKTGSELSDYALSENGFKLDMANSKYLTIDVQYSTITKGKDDELKEDIRFNRPAKDGESYTKEGIYTFRVSNQYTGDSTTKTIFVGTDKYIKLLSSSGMTIDRLNDQIKSGLIDE